MKMKFKEYISSLSKDQIFVIPAPFAIIAYLLNFWFSKPESINGNIIIITLIYCFMAFVLYLMKICFNKSNITK